jgi:hypothetical protein
VLLIPVPELPPVLLPLHQLALPAYALPPTSVGATLLFFAGACSGFSSFSDSLAVVSRLPSTLAPLTELAALKELLDKGVCGGVVIGMLMTAPELVAATLGTLPRVGVGLPAIFRPDDCGCSPKESWVAIEDVDDVRVGLTGRTGGAEEAAEGVGATLFSTGAVEDVGVGVGVD